MNFTKPKNIEKKAFNSDVRDKVYYNALLSEINELDSLNQSAASYSNKWLDSAGQQEYLKTQKAYYNNVNSIKSKLENSVDLYKSVLGEKGFNTLYTNLQNELNNQATTMANIENQFNLYSKFKTADEYNNAKKASGYYMKSQRFKTAEEVEEYLKSDQYLQLRKTGVVSDEEHEYYIRRRTELADSKRLSDEIEYLENFIKQGEYDLYDHMNHNTQKPSAQNPNAPSANLSLNPFTLDPKVKKTGKEAELLEENIKKAKDRLAILKAEYVQKKDQEEFDAKWAKDFEEMKVSNFTSDIDISKIVDEDDYKTYGKYVSEDEKKYIAWLKKNKGEEKAQDYYDDLIDVRLDKEYNQDLFDENYDYAAKDGWQAAWASAKSVAYNLGSGFEWIGNVITGNWNRRSTLSSKASGAREGTKSHWDGSKAEDVFDMLYDTGMSGLEMAPTAISAFATGGTTAVAKVITGAGTAMLSGSAAASKQNELLDRGITGFNVFLGALAAGTAEYLFEKWSIDSMLNMNSLKGLSGVAKAKTFVGNMFKSIGVNASEELNTELANIVLDDIINPSLSQYAYSVHQYYMNDNLSIEEAKKKAATDLGIQIAIATVSGGLMGLGFGSITSVGNYVSSKINDYKAGKLILSKPSRLGEFKTLVQNSNLEGVKKAAEKLSDKSKASKIGNVFNQAVKLVMEDSQKQLISALKENGAKDGGSNSAKGWADYIYKTAISPKNNKTTLQETMLRINKITGSVYSAFVDEGKYGGDTLLTLNELVTPAKTKTATQGNSVGAAGAQTVINEQGVEVPITADSQPAAGPVATGGIKGIAAAPGTGEIRPITEAYGRSVAERLEEERPNPKTQKKLEKKYLADTVQITPEQEQILKDFGKANGLNIEFVDGLVNGKGYGYFDNDKTIVISRYSKKPMAALFKHEFTHTVERSKLYQKFQDYLFSGDSAAFNEWLSLKGFESASDAIDYEMSKYKRYKVDYNKNKDGTEKNDKKANNYERAKADVVADFVGDYLFGEADAEITTDFLSELKKADRGLFKRFVDWVHSILKRLTTKGVVDKDIIKLEQKFKRLAETSRAERTDAQSGKKGEGQYSLSSENKYADFDKPITARDIEILRSIGRKSVNDFTAEDIEKAQKWAYKFYQQLGEKSPFFRAWFGDWRAYDKTPITIAIKKGDARGLHKNADTGWNISISAKVFNETKVHRSSINQSAVAYLPYINQIVENAILLDTTTVDKAKSENSLLMHSLYAVADIGNGPELLKLYVEEMNNPNLEDTSKRAYQLQNIEKASTASVRVQGKSSSSLTNTVNAINTVADLFAVVKQKDKNFNPKSVDKHLLNKDGTPKKFYHGTSYGGFASFDTYGGRFGLFGKGSYFTEDKNVADSYQEKGKGNKKQTYPVYLSSNKTLDMDAQADISMWNEAVPDARGYFDDCETNEDCFRALKEYCVDEEMVRWEAEELITDVISYNMGYDAITYIGGGRWNKNDSTRHRVYIIFEPGQIKSATSNIGTFDMSEGDIRYSLPDVGVKQQLKDNLDKLNSMEIVANLNEQKTFTSKQDVANWALNKFEKIGFKVYRDDFGEIILDEKRVKSGLRYLKTKEERLALALLPDVLSKGVEIGTHPNHKGRNYNTFTFAAPVMINGQRGNMAAVVRQEDKNYYKVHRLIMPDGSHFVLDEKRDTAERAGGVDNNSGLSPTDNVSNTSIPNLAENVKGQYSLPDIPDIARGKSNTELRVLVDEGKITEDEALAEISRQFGEMEKGENPKVDVTVPQKVSEKQGVRRFARTTLESGHLTEGMSENAKKEMIDGALNYRIVSNREAVRTAEKKIENDIEAAIKEWESVVNSGKIPTQKDIALAEALMVEAAKDGHENDVALYLTEIAALGTQMGQSIQALSLLKKLSGVGQVQYISRVIAQLNADLERRYGSKYVNKIKLDPSFENILRNSKNPSEIEEIVDDILTDVARQMPSTWLDKFNAWRYLAMLGNTRTHIRNFFGNAVFLPAVRIKDVISAVAERVFIRDAAERTKVFKVKKQYRDIAKADFEKVQELITRGGKMSPSDIVQDRRKIFTSKAFSWLEKARQFNFNMLEKEDLIFLKSHYVYALGSILQARGIDINALNDTELTKIRNIAIKEAQKATYRDFSFFAEALNKMAHPKKTGHKTDALTKIGGFLVEGAVPFKKTPINILKRGIEYSPIGIATSIANAISDYRRGEFSKAELLDGLAAGMTGTMVMLFGMLLQSIGIITGGLDYDDEDALERMAGAQPYAINFGDVSFTIDWMAPMIMPFMIGAEISKANEAGENLNLMDALATVGEPLSELSMLSGINDVIEGVAYSGANGLGVFGEVATNLASSYVSQFFPTLGGQIARTIDPTRRTNFVDKNSSVPSTVQKTVQKILGKIPVAENSKVPYIDAWGRTEENDNILLRAFENFVSPGYISKVKDDAVNDELAKIFVDTGESGVIPKRAKTSFEVNGETVNLSADEYVQYAIDKGQYSRQYLEEVMSNPLYQGLSSEEKAAVISNLYSFANAKAKSNVSDYDYITNNYYKTAAKLEVAGISPVSYYIAKVAMSEENADTDGSGTVTKSEKTKALEEAGFNSEDIDTILNINK